MTKVEIFEIGLFLSTLALGGFCFIIWYRLKKLSNLEEGLGQAIAVMVLEVERFEKALQALKPETEIISKDLNVAVERARAERKIWDLHRGNIQNPMRDPSINMVKRIRGKRS